MNICPHAYRETSGGALRCRKMTAPGQPPYCLFQKRCEARRRYENTPSAQKCSLRK